MTYNMRNIRLLCLITCIVYASLPMCTSVGDVVNDVRVDVPSVAWEGEGTAMTCTLPGISGNTWKLKWFKGSELVYLYKSWSNTGRTYNSLVDRSVGRLDGNVHTLSINITAVTDEGSYMCTVGTQQSEPKKLTVNVKPQGVSMTGLDQRVKQNTDVEVTCKVSRVKPQAVINWRKGLHGSLQTKTATKVTNSDGTFKLTSTYKVSFSRSDHNAQVYCLVTLPGNTPDVWVNTSETVNVAYQPLTKVAQANTQKPTDGSSMTLTCDITDGNPIDIIKNVIWQNGDTTLSSGRYHVSGRNLTISSLNHTLDDGQYSCAAENEAGMGDFSATFQLLVNFKPTVSATTSDPVVEGRSVTIRCQSQGARPTVTSVTWKKDREIITVTTDTKYTGGTVQNPSLTIDPIMRTDGGQYTCQLSNEVGQGYKSVTLEVLYKPSGQATVEPTSVTVAAEGQMSLNCHAPTESGNPAASWFTWRKQNSDFSRNTTGVLRLTPSRVDESGEFSCVAGNWIGQSDYSDWATVTVQAPVKVEYPRIEHIPRTPAFDNQDFNMTCIVSGSGDVKVAWLKDGVSVDTGDFAVTTVQLTDGQYMYGQTDAKKSTLMWRVTKGARYFTCNNITHLDGNYTCAVTTETAGAMTHDVSKAFVVNVQYEAHWTSGPTITTTELGDPSKEIVCSVCANPQPSFLWTFNNKPLREGIHVRGDRITMDVVTVGDFGPFHCIATNEVEGESKTVTFQIDLVKSGPAREPSDFTVLRNHTSIALTLQWHPGYDGGYPPQTYTLQYSASNKVGRKTWSDIFSYTSDAMTWYQATVTGLQPQTQYVFSLYAENNRPRDKGPNRSLTVTQTGSTTASPQVTIASVKLEKDHMTVTWSYNGQSSRRKRSTSTNVSVVIYYQPDGGEEAHYPLQGNVAAEERQVTINGQFDDKVKYKVWLKVYEGLLDVSFQQTKTFEAAVEKEPPRPSGSTSGVVIGASVAAVGGIAIIVSLIVLFVYCYRIKNKDSNDTQAQSLGSGITVQQPAIAMNEDFRPATDDMTDQYQSLTSSADISPNQGTYARLSKPEESTNLPTPGPTYEEIGTGGLTKHSYVNASVSCDDGAEYSEVKETATPQKQPTYQNITT